MKEARRRRFFVPWAHNWKTRGEENRGCERGGKGWQIHGNFFLSSMVRENGSVDKLMFTELRGTREGSKSLSFGIFRVKSLSWLMSEIMKQ